MKNLLVVVVLSLVLPIAGCTTVHRAPGTANKYDTVPYGPTNKQRTPQTGLVSYYLAGLDSITESRRKSLYKKMYNLCDGKYRIVNEYKGSIPYGYTTTTTGGQEAYGFKTPLQSRTTQVSSTEIYIEFECVDK